MRSAVHDLDGLNAEPDGWLANWLAGWLAGWLCILTLRHLGLV